MDAIYTACVDRLTNGVLLTITSRQDDGDFAFEPSVSQIKPGLSTPVYKCSADCSTDKICIRGIRTTWMNAILHDISKRPTQVKLTHSDSLEVRKSPGKGRGVFARKDIKKGTMFEVVPLIVFDNAECEGAKMATYVFEWTKKTSAIALGYGSLYNHSFQPNARYYDGKNETKEFVALVDIKAGDEITVNYNGNPKKQDKVDFDVIENGNGHVANGKAVAANGKPVNGAALNGQKTESKAAKKKTTVRKKARTAGTAG